MSIVSLLSCGGSVLESWPKKMEDDLPSIFVRNKKGYHEFMGDIGSLDDVIKAVNMTTKSRENRGIVVGVNWVGELFETDYLCLKDQIVIDRGRLMAPRIGFVDSGNVGRLWKGRRSYENFSRWDRVTGWGGPSVCQYTFPDALRWCLEKWPDREVRVYGCDMDDLPNIAGYDDCHGGARWRAEKPFVDRMIKLHGDRVKFVGCRMGDIMKEIG